MMVSRDLRWKETVAKKGLVKKDQGAIAADKNENKIERIKDNKTDTLIKQNSDSENNQAQNFIQSEHNKFQDNTNLNALLNTNQNGAEHKEENDDEDEGSILNQSYEDIFSIEQNKQKKIKKLALNFAYQSCGNQSRIRCALDENKQTIGIAKSDFSSRPVTKNCLDYAFLASCGERVPYILCQLEEDDMQYEVQKFFSHDGENNYFSPNTNDSPWFFRYAFGDLAQHTDIDNDGDNGWSVYRSYLRMYHLLTGDNMILKQEFIDHFTTLLVDELCFNLVDRNKGNIIVVPSKNKNEIKRDIVNIDIEFYGWPDQAVIKNVYLVSYLILIKEKCNFSISEKADVSKINKSLDKYYYKRDGNLNFNFKQSQQLKLSPEIIAEIETKIKEKIKQRLNFNRKKFVQYYIDNCIRRGDIDTKTAFSDYQKFVESLYQLLKNKSDALKNDQDLHEFSQLFSDFMEKNPSYQIFNNLSEEDFNTKWIEREEALKNPKKIEKKDGPKKKEVVVEASNIKDERNKNVEKASNLQFYKKGFWISLCITIVSSFGGSFTIAWLGVSIFWIMPTPIVGVVATGYFLWQFQKNKFEYEIPNNSSTSDDYKNYYNLKSKHDERRVPDLNEKPEIKQKVPE